KTGFAVNIAQNSAPTVIANRIIQNRTGVIVQAKARPVLRSNIIEDSSEDGLVALADAQPDLGTTSEPGSNTFRNNARYDINANKAKQTFPAFGNTFGDSPEPERTVGNIDFAGTTVVVAPPPANIPTIQPATAPRTNVSPRNRPSGDSEAFPTPSSLTTIERSTERPTPSAVEIPVPPPETAADYSSDSQSPQNLMSPTNQSGAIGGNGGEDTLEFSAPETPSETTSSTDDTPATARNSRRPQSPLPSLEPAPVGEAALLPVPDTNIPLGTGSRRVSNPRPATNRRSPSTPRGAMRVVVEISNAQEEALVREIVPEAFRTVDNGQVLMQVGVFSNRNNAEQMVQKLNSNGLKAKMEPVNR
ncbi:MAG: DUF1565 domain-containing protein, partial [Nostocaceae cyanobacterium]|nr:DUF1565 domain-containing protein [Nostocaceae cyanobacterium]